MQNLKLMTYKGKEIVYIFLIFLFSISINQYYGNLGVCPIDSFWFFNSGYDTLNGYYPFRDYWTIAGPFITFTQAYFFKFLGVSWFSYVLHASIFNFLISFFVFFTFYKLKLNIHYCLFYALLTAVIAYPSAGTPYVDHHASILSIIALLIFILAIKTKSEIYWFILPIILFLSFLTKQTPTGNLFIIISVLSIFYFIINFNIKKIIFGFLGSVLIVTLFFLTLYLSKIPFQNFFDQYISFPLSIGKTRVEYFLFPLEFSRIILRFKLIHIPLLIMIFISIQKIKNHPKYIYNDDFIIILSLLSSSYALIAHQLMTINGMFIFFVIPMLIGFAHIYLVEHYKKKNYFLYFLIILSFCSTIYYWEKYIHKRDFMDLRAADFNKKTSAEIFDYKLKGLQWISCLSPENPKEEIYNLNKAINIIKNDKRKKSILTDYQFISVILSKYDYSPTQVWFINHVVNQKKDSEYFKSYKKLLINQINKNKIKIVYLIKPLWGGNDIFEKGLENSCYKKIKVTEIMDSYIIQDCKELGN